MYVTRNHNMFGNTWCVDLYSYVQFENVLLSERVSVCVFIVPRIK